MLELPEALPIHTLSKLHYIIHKRYPTNHLSFPELLNCGTHCHPLLSMNPTISHVLILVSKNLILSPFLRKLSLIFSVFPLSRLCYRLYGLSLALLTKRKKNKIYPSYIISSEGSAIHYIPKNTPTLAKLLYSNVVKPRKGYASKFPTFSKAS